MRRIAIFLIHLANSPHIWPALVLFAVGYWIIKSHSFGIDATLVELAAWARRLDSRTDPEIVWGLPCMFLGLLTIWLTSLKFLLLDISQILLRIVIHLEIASAFFVTLALAVIAVSVARSSPGSAAVPTYGMVLLMAIHGLIKLAGPEAMVTHAHQDRY